MSCFKSKMARQKPIFESCKTRIHLLFLIEIYWQLHRVHTNIKTTIENARISQLFLIAIDLEHFE